MEFFEKFPQNLVFELKNNKKRRLYITKRRWFAANA
jgi:hypothetical protein